MTDIQPIVIDVGSGMMRCGFSGDDAPRAVFPTITGRRKGPAGMMVTADYLRTCVGDEALARRGILRLSYPVEYGVVTDWNRMEKVFSHVLLGELHLESAEYPTLVSEGPSNSNGNREKTTELFFEEHHATGFSLVPRSVLAMYASGRVSGTLLRCGETVCCAAAVVEGHVLPCTTQVLKLGGRDVTERIVEILAERGYEMTTSAEREIVRDAKEKFGLVSLDYEEEMMRNEALGTDAVEYELPDGSLLPLSTSRFRGSELLFRPSLCLKRSEIRSCQGIQDLVVKSIQCTDPDLQKVLKNNLVCAGGTSCLSGFADRLEKELRGLTPEGVVMKVYLPPEARYMSWIGGSIWSSLPRAASCWITPEEYREFGKNIVHRKCF